MAEKTLKEIIKEEYKKCLVDPIYFMKKYVKIQHPIRGTINFNLYPFQEETLSGLVENDFNIILKSRQMGISTLVAAYSLWLMVFHTDKNIRCISITQETSKEIVTRVRFANDNLPLWLKVPLVENNRLSLVLKNGSTIKAESSAGTAGRSAALSLLIIDEAAFIDNIEEIWLSAQYTLSTGGRAIVLSTPNGVGNFFHSTWVDAEGKKNNFHTTKLPWHLHPERDQKWRDQQTQLSGVKGSAQECFDGNTRIYTKGGLRKIEDIKIGDLVLTHNGKFEPVIHKFEKESSDYSLVNSSIVTKKVKVTNNHPFLTKNNEWKELKNINSSDLCNSFPDIIDINENIETLDLYTITKPNFFKYKLCNDDYKFFINDRKHKTIHNRYVKCDYKLGYIIGCYLAEGYCSNDHNRVDFSFNWNTERNDWPERVKEYITDIFGISSYQYRCQDNSGHLTFCSQIICKTIMLLTTGDNCYNKKLSDLSFDIQNKEYLTGIVDGCFVGDGSILEHNVKTFSSTSENLSYDVKYILHMLNFGLISHRESNVNHPIYSKTYILSILNTYKLKCDDRMISSLLKKDSYKLNYTRKNVNGIDNNIQYSQLFKETPTEISPIKTYNLTVLNDNSYVTEHFIVHNCDCDFSTTGNTVIDIPTLDFYKSEKIKDPIEMRGIDKSYWIWEYPDYSRSYIVCADVARGDGADYSAFHVIDIESFTQVAEYQGLISTTDYGNMLVTVATEYNNALLVVENANIGWAVLQQIIDRAYPNTFYSSADLQYVDIERQISNRFNAMEKKMVPGFTTTMKTRPLIVSRLEMYFRERTIEVRSARLINELRTFIWNGNKPEALPKYHDDLVMSFSIGMWVRDTALRLRQQGVDITKSLISNINKIGNADPIYKSGNLTSQQAWEMNVGKIGSDKKESLNWLL